MTFWDETVPLTPANLNSSTVPVGGIIMYSGVIANLPENWSLCDGTGGTPDLRGRFVVGAEGSYEQGDTGGADVVALEINNLPAHSHTSGSLSTNSNGSHTHSTSGTIWMNASHSYPSGGELSLSFNRSPTSQSINSAGSHSHSISGTTGSLGSDDAHENRPPYYALAFVMRVG